jgi:mono/diheme cytochrome c family protein
MPCHRIPTTLVAILVLLGGASAAHAADPTFSKDIGPILSSRCSNCHGPKRQKNDLRLDSAEGVKKGGKNGPIFIAGDPAKSPMYHRTTRPPNDEERMPATGEPLTKAQTDLIKAWIAAGAKFD